MIEIEDDGSGDTDGREEGVSASVVSYEDTPPILEFSEHVLDLMAVPIQTAVMRYLDLAINL